MGYGIWNSWMWNSDTFRIEFSKLVKTENVTQLGTAYDHDV